MSRVTLSHKMVCSVCGAIGYKPTVREERHRKDSDANGIRAYSCSKCSAPAVGHDPIRLGRAFEWRCPAHRSKEAVDK